MLKHISELYQEIDNTPVEIPTRLRLPQNRTDQMRAFIRHEMSVAAQQAGHETFEEADDLEPEDEESLPYTRYELADLEPAASDGPQGTLPLTDGVRGPVDPGPKVEGSQPPSVAPAATSPAPVDGPKS